MFSSSLLLFFLSGTQQRVREGNGDVGKGGFARRVQGGGQKELGLRLSAPPPSELVQGLRTDVAVALLSADTWHQWLCSPQIPGVVQRKGGRVHCGSRR